MIAVEFTGVAPDEVLVLLLLKTHTGCSVYGNACQIADIGSHRFPADWDTQRNWFAQRL